jgi:outer membrane receptor for ferrienterochelin and colicins
MPRRLIVAAMAVFAAVNVAGGQQTDTVRAATRDTFRTLDPVVVTAARRDERRSSALISTAVVSRQDVRDAGATDVASVLVQQLGVQVGGGAPAGTQVLMQGLGEQRVLVLLDGQPITGRVGGVFDLSRLPTSIVERIEVVKGPQSVLYGTDAMGGVINIITRRPGARPGSRQRLAPEASIVAGSHGRFDIASRIAGDAWTSLGYGVDVGRNHVDLAPGVASDAGAFANRWTVSPRMAWRPSATLSVDAGGLGVAESQRYRSGQLYSFADNTQLDAHITGAWARGTTRLTPTIALSTFDHLSRASTAARPASDSGARDAQRLAIGSLTYSGFVRSIVVDGGTEIRRESIVADRVPGKRVTNAVAVFAQATWMASRISIAPGVRGSWSEQWGTSFTPRIAAITRPFGEAAPITLRASVARGFRAPDFKELYLRFVNAAAGYAVAGNDTLHPERSLNTSAELAWAGADFDVRVSGFHNDIRDLIETVGPDTTGTFTYDNVGRATTAGLELELGRRWSSLEVAGGYSYLHTRDVSTGGPILGQAAHSGRARLRLDAWNDVRLILSALYTGDAPSSRDALGNVTTERQSLTQLNLRLVRTLALGAVPGVEVSLGADDLFDARRGLEWPGFTGRQLSVGVAWPAAR